MTQASDSSSPVHSPGSTTDLQAAELITQVRTAVDQLHEQISKTIVGQKPVIDELLIALLCRGHALLVGVPGLAKTLLVSSIAKSLSLQFSRIQFTPDLMPTDITGTEVIEEDRATGKRHLRLVHGPVFGNMILADEINRTPPKTQAALLEAMQEHHVTAGGKTHSLPQPFFVLATQNPIEQEGTYPLPEAQLDRFMFMIGVGYPDEAEELEIVKRTTMRSHAKIEPVLDAQKVQQLQEWVRDVPVADHVIRYALRLVRATRKPEGPGKPDIRPDFIKKYLSWARGPEHRNISFSVPRPALLDGRTHPSTADVAAVAHPVLRHRMIANFNAQADGITTDQLIDQLIDLLKPDATDAATARQINAVLR